MASKRPASKQPSKKLAKWEHPAGSEIIIAETPNQTGGKAYGVSYRIRIPAKLTGGKREQFQRGTKEEAERFAEDRFVALKAYGTEFAKIPPAGQKQAAMAWGILAEHNEKERTAAREKAGGTLPKDFDSLQLKLVDVVRAGIRALRPAGGQKTVSEVIAELTELKSERLASGGIGSNTVHDFNVRCGRIETVFGSRFVSDVLHTEIADWLRKLRKGGAQFGGALSTRSVKNYRNTLAEIFKHAEARQYCPESPFRRFTREDFKTLGGENSDRDLDGINILTVDEARKLLRAAHESDEPGMLASVVLRLFCGIRTAEVCRLDWSEVHWLDPQPYVHIPAGKAKKRRIRHVDIPENALAWLKLCNPPASGRIVPGTEDPRTAAKYYCVRFRRIVKAAGMGKETEDGNWQSEWESNDTRHSFGSYHYALHSDALRTAAQMGHKQNDDVLFAHYRTLVRHQQAEEYFGLKPEAAAAQIMAFPRAAC